MKFHTRGKRHLEIYRFSGNVKNNHYLNAPNLHNEVAKRCPDGTPIPSVQWLRWQFWPRHAGKSSAKRYSGRIKVKYMVMARQFRAEHIDSHYASAIWRYENEFSLMYREFTKLVCQDDKHTIKIGEPNYPVAAIERGKQVLVSIGQSAQVADHDFTKMSFSPSVSIDLDLPEEIGESFHTGQVYVGLKENSFQPSTCLRHLTEYSIADSISSYPIECHYHDGGCDHNVRHLRSKLANIAYFLKKDLDFLCSVQTPPKHSWKNPAERVISVLNIGLQGVGVMRDPTASCEQSLKRANGISGIRKLAESQPVLKNEVIKCVSKPKTLLESVFQQLSIKSRN